MAKYNHLTVIQENKRRLAELYERYDPLMGIGCSKGRFFFKFDSKTGVWLPETMKNIPFIEQLLGPKHLGWACREIYGQDYHDKVPQMIEAINVERIPHDFEFWASTCVVIQDKLTKELIPFKLNKPQRKLLQSYEDSRLAGEPIREILLKARQWGGSTLTQLYMAWIQLFHKTRWHSAVVADVEDQAKNIRGMYKLMAENHPKDVMDVQMRPYQGSSKNREIADRDCALAIGSMQQPDNLRSFDFAMAHFSEVGIWKATKGKQPKDLIQAIRSTVPNVHLSMVVLESTAKGVGNYFHNEWLDAVNKVSGYKATFVAWFEIEMYQLPITNTVAFIDKMRAYDWFQWECGATLEGINWYKQHKKNENMDTWRMQSEFPTTATEAFASTGRRAFAPLYVLNAREFNRKPEFIGDITGDAQSGQQALNNIQFTEDSNGPMMVWDMPDKSVNIKNRYVVPVDIGGRTSVADFSIIRVFDRLQLMNGGVPEAILTWKGHCFVPGTLIYTTDGFKNIESVNIGDLVWTHKNRFRKVIKTYKKQYDGDIVSIRSQGNYETVTCTPEHPFFSNDVVSKYEKKPWGPDKFQSHMKEYVGNPKWVSANDLKFVAYSRDIDDNDNTQFIINKYNGGKSKDTYRTITDLRSFYSIVGYYLAEGHINKRHTDKKPCSICFSFSYKEKDTVAKDCYDKLLSLGFKSSIIEYKSVGVCRVRAYDTNLAVLVLKLCGEHSWGKSISPEILSSSKELLSELIDSYWKGDGSVYKTDQTISNTVTTVSQVLARQVRDILILLGHRPGIYRVDAKTIGVNIATKRIRYNIVWSATAIKKNVLLQNEDNVLYRVKAKTTQQYSGLVYNLEVEEDNSYSTACYTVHNCDQDLVIWKAVQIAKAYNNALLAPESNSLRTKTNESEGDHIVTIMDEIKPFYDNLYSRTDPEKVRQGAPVKYGFHTNSKTKVNLIDNLNKLLRESGYIEPDSRVCDEYDVYEMKPDGTYGAVEGQHDDMVMCSAIGLKVSDIMDAPVEIVKREVKPMVKTITEANF